MNELTESFFGATLEEIKRGYVYNEANEEFHCLLCGQTFIKGVIYQQDEVFYDAEKFTRLHIEGEHESVFDYLLNLGKKVTGLTDHQKVLLDYFHQGYSDNEIIKQLGGGGSASTIRNHRFSLREKEKQAKVFLAIMELVDRKVAKKQAEGISASRREELKREYKETPRPAGVYQVKNNVNGKILIGATPNLQGMFNRLRFELKIGSHRNHELQREWKEYGDANFTIEAVEEVKPLEGTREERRKALEALEQKWLEQLQPYGDRGYHQK